MFRLVVFRPFVDEVCIGKIISSNEQGVQVSLGFFDEIFIPAYWMLRPSHYNHNSGLWVWVPPDYGDAENEENEQGDDMEDVEDKNTSEEDAKNGFDMEIGRDIRFKVKALHFTQITNTAKGVQATTTTTSQSLFNPMMVKRARSISGGSTSDAHNEDTGLSKPVRKRSSSVDLTNNDKKPACFYIVASICEDGLGLTR